MTDIARRSSIDLEKRWSATWSNEPDAARLLERIAKFGSAVALAPVLVAACRAPRARRRRDPRRRRRPRPPPSTAERARRRRSHPRGRAQRLQLARLHRRGRHRVFEEKYGVKVNYDLFDDIYAAYEKLGDDGGGYDVSFPIGVDVPAFRAGASLLKLDQSLIPNLENLGPSGPIPATTPATSTRCRTCGGRPASATTRRRSTDLRQLERALGPALDASHISMMDDYAETFGLTLIQQGFSANTTNTAELDQALARLQEQKPLVRTYTNDTVTTMAAGDVWIGMIWGSDVYQISLERRRELRLLHPRGGRRPGLGHDGDLLGRRAPDRRPPVHQPHARRRGQRREHELHRLHGPERGGQGVHPADILGRIRRSTRTRRSSRSSRSSSTSAGRPTTSTSSAGDAARRLTRPTAFAPTSRRTP